MKKRAQNLMILVAISPLLTACPLMDTGEDSYEAICDPGYRYIEEEDICEKIPHRDGHTYTEQDQQYPEYQPSTPSSSYKEPTHEEVISNNRADYVGRLDENNMVKFNSDGTLYENYESGWFHGDYLVLITSNTIETYESPSPDGWPDEMTGNYPDFDLSYIPNLGEPVSSSNILSSSNLGSNDSIYGKIDGVTYEETALYYEGETYDFVVLGTWGVVFWGSFTPEPHWLFFKISDDGLLSRRSYYGD